VAIRGERRDRKHKHGHHDDNEVARGRNQNRNTKNKANDAAAAKRRRDVEERRKKQQAARASTKNRNDKGNDKDGHGHNKKSRRRVTRAKFIRTKFAHNTANKGGAIWNDGSHTEVEDSFFVMNTVRFGGYYIYTFTYACMYIRTCIAVIAHQQQQQRQHASER
jgi:hypothetical protein